MTRSPSTKPYVIDGPKGREYKTLGGLLRACANASGNHHCHLRGEELFVEWPHDVVVRYKVTESEKSFHIEAQLGYDLLP